MSHPSRAAGRASLRAMSLVGAALLGAGPATAQSTFFRGDWELACDNTRTCRAVGYQSDQGEGSPVALLVEREAGPNKAAKLQVMLGRLDREPSVPFPSQVNLVIDGRTYGHVVLVGEGDTGEITSEQAAVLLRAVLGTGEVAFEASDGRWVLSTTGANAVLLRMDDLQGRVDTAGALVRKGNRPESKVLLALAPPVVRAAPLADPRPGDEALGERIRPYLAVGKDDYCERLDPSVRSASKAGEAGGPEKGLINVRRLAADRVMLSAPCWRAADASGQGVWVAADKPPYEPKLVTTSATAILGQTIESHVMGRSLGDCSSADTWAWNGRDFIHTSSSTTGMCKLVAAGGAWTLPTIVTSGGTSPTR